MVVSTTDWANTVWSLGLAGKARVCDLGIEHLKADDEDGSRDIGVA